LTHQKIRSIPIFEVKLFNLSFPQNTIQYKC
jgi:hypothetical protein